MFVKIKAGLYLNPNNVVAIEGSSTTKDACNIIMVNGHRYYVYATPDTIRAIFEGNIDALVDRNRPV